jgi:hypothetical protein
MTLSEVADVGARCLKEYEGRLKVKGARAYDGNRDEKKYGIECMLERLTEADVRRAVVEVLNQLEQVGEFMMSEPRDKIAKVPTESRRVGNLRITFEYSSSVTEGKSLLWIYCWYYPTRK